MESFLELATGFCKGTQILLDYASFEQKRKRSTLAEAILDFNFKIFERHLRNRHIQLIENVALRGKDNSKKSFRLLMDLDGMEFQVFSE